MNLPNWRLSPAVDSVFAGENDSSDMLFVFSLPLDANRRVVDADDDDDDDDDDGET